MCVCQHGLEFRHENNSKSISIRGQNLLARPGKNSSQINAALEFGIGVQRLNSAKLVMDKDNRDKNPPSVSFINLYASRGACTIQKADLPCVIRIDSVPIFANPSKKVNQRFTIQTDHTIFGRGGVIHSSVIIPIDQVKMPHFYDTLPTNLQEWALAQPLFFIASAPLKGKHVNLSPKGRPSACLSIFDSSHVAYLDLTGSGAETISHIYENGRVTVMFCSFDGRPRIMRLFCTGRVIEWDMPDFKATIDRMNKTEMVGTRAVILLDIWKVVDNRNPAITR